MEVAYRPLSIDDITLELFLPFQRYQEVTQCWRNIAGTWVLKDVPFVDDWEESEKAFLVDCLQSTVKTNGMVYGAFDNHTLAGFASLESAFFGTERQYLQLSSIHTSHSYRGQGIGKHIFRMICRKAKQMGAVKLYISAHSAKETQGFYHALGCDDALEINKELVAKEPFDRQLEYDLTGVV